MKCGHGNSLDKCIYPKCQNTCGKERPDCEGATEEKTMLDAVELLDSYKKSATAAILDVTDNKIGAGTDPISFVICSFRSQADKIKEMLAMKKKSEPGIDTIGFELALAYLRAPMVEPAREELNNHLRDRGLEEVLR